VQRSAPSAVSTESGRLALTSRNYCFTLGRSMQRRPLWGDVRAVPARADASPRKRSRHARMVAPNNVGLRRRPTRRFSRVSELVGGLTQHVRSRLLGSYFSFRQEQSQHLPPAPPGRLDWTLGSTPSKGPAGPDDPPRFHYNSPIVVTLSAKPLLPRAVAATPTVLKKE